MQKTKKKRGEEEPMDVDDGPTPTQNGDDDMNGDIDHISDDEEGGVRIGDIYIPPAPKPALTFDATGPRLIITHIVNENFKSYAGVQTLGPFHKVIVVTIYDTYNNKLSRISNSWLSDRLNYFSDFTMQSSLILSRLLLYGDNLNDYNIEFPMYALLYSFFWKMVDTVTQIFKHIF